MFCLPTERLAAGVAHRWVVRQVVSRLRLASFAATITAAMLAVATAQQFSYQLPYQLEGKQPEHGPMLLAGGGPAERPLTLDALELQFVELQATEPTARPALPAAATGRLLYDLRNLLPATGQRAELLRPDALGRLWPWPVRLNVRRSASELTFLPMPAEAGALSGFSIDLQRGWLRLPSLPNRRIPALQSGRGYRWDFASQQLAGGQAIRGQLMLQRLPQGGTLLVYHYTQMAEGQLRSGNVLLTY